MEKDSSKIKAELLAAKKIPVILGPTCTGKTDLGLRLCQHLGGEIVSADSRQVFKGMDIGTGKISSLREFQEKGISKDSGVWLQEGINIWGYDLIFPEEYFSAQEFANFGLNKAHHIFSLGKIPFLVGGTGLYIDFFTGRIRPNINPPNFSYRKELEAKTLSELQNLVSLLGAKANASDFSNKRRLVRIVERLSFDRDEKNKISSEKAKDQKALEPYFSPEQFIFIGLTSSRTILYAKADKWVDSIWNEESLIMEIKSLLSKYSPQTPQLQGFIYKEGLKFLNGELSKSDAIQKTKFSIHAYIRRQQTYFKRNPDISWFDISKDNWRENVYNLLSYGLK